jgi:hypothetical protein
MTSAPWNLTFAEAVEQITVGDCGRSRLPTDDGDKFAAERLHPKGATRRCRTKSDVLGLGLVASRASPTPAHILLSHPSFSTYAMA